MNTTIKWHLRLFSMIRHDVWGVYRGRITLEERIDITVKGLFKHLRKTVIKDRKKCGVIGSTSLSKRDGLGSSPNTSVYDDADYDLEEINGLLKSFNWRR